MGPWSRKIRLGTKFLTGRSAYAVKKCGFLIKIQKMRNMQPFCVRLKPQERHTSIQRKKIWSEMVSIHSKMVLQSRLLCKDYTAPRKNGFDIGQNFLVRFELWTKTATFFTRNLGLRKKRLIVFDTRNRLEWSLVQKNPSRYEILGGSVRVCSQTMWLPY